MLPPLAAPCGVKLLPSLTGHDNAARPAAKLLPVPAIECVLLPRAGAVPEPPRRDLEQLLLRAEEPVVDPHTHRRRLQRPALPASRGLNLAQARQAQHALK